MAFITKAWLFKRLDDVFGPWMCRCMTRAQTSVTYPDPDTLEGRILVIRPGGIGDAVMLLPMLTALRGRFPGRGIDVLGERRNRDIFNMAFPDVTVLAYDERPLGTLRHLRSTRYAMALDTEQFHHFSGVLAAISLAPLRVGFKINVRRNPLYTHLVNYDLEGREDRQFGRLLEALCGRVIALPSKVGILGRLKGEGGEVEGGQDCVSEPPRPSGTPPQEGNLTPHSPPAEGCPKGGVVQVDLHTSPMAMVHVGGSVPEKRWEAAKFAALCERLTVELGMRCVLVGDRRDALYAQEVARLCKEQVTDMCGTLSLRQVAELSRRVAVFVGPDSGIAHIANAAGAPCVVLFGPSDPLKWGPEGGRAVRCDVPCGPCAIFGCNKPCIVYTCMKSITAGAVVDAVSELVKGKL